MFIKPFKRLIKEFRDKETLELIGYVEDNNDPLKLGRVRVRTSIYEDIPTEKLPWARPKLNTFLGLSINSIMISVPEIGSQVCIYFPEQDIYHPTYKGADLTNFNKCSLFDEDYPNSYGFKDSIGNFFKVNKSQKTVQFQHSSSSNVIFDENGSLIATLVDGTVIKADVTTHDIDVTCTNKITFNCNKLAVNALSEVNMISPSIILDGNVVITTGATGSITGLDGTIETVSNGVVTNLYGS